MHEVYLGIGGNTGDKNSNFKKVYNLIEKELGKIIKKSSIYKSPPWGFHAKEYFWNQVLLIETKSLPSELLHKIHQIQNLFKREVACGRYASREMDIDILYFDDIILESDELVIPHPQMQYRLFVLVPLNEIAPDFIHPRLGLSGIELLNRCEDDSLVEKTEPF
jgi:2-amino-4-hydroxy-6-hydroxymethyldihydropteridine diphosphokinase